MVGGEHNSFKENNSIHLFLVSGVYFNKFFKTELEMSKNTVVDFNNYLGEVRNLYIDLT